MMDYRGPAPTVPLLKCPTCGSDDSFTSWELTTMAYHGVRFFEAPDGSGRSVDYDGVYDTESGDGEYADDITCTHCDTLNLGLADLLTADGKTGKRAPTAPAPLTADQIHVLLDLISGDGEPWDGYTSDPADDPKASRDGWYATLASAKDALGELLNHA